MRCGGFQATCALTAALAAAALAADFGPGARYDGSAWLVWDNGTPNPDNYTLSGWIGHEFDVSTLAYYTYVNKFRMYMRAWPNRRWDGGYIGIYAFTGGVPGSRIWGPKFALPTAEGWNDFDVGYYLGSRKKFLAYWDAFYNYPDGDTLCFDTGPGRARTWIYVGGSWVPFRGVDANLMLRAEVDDEHNPAVAPTSLGKVKALFQ